MQKLISISKLVKNYYTDAGEIKVLKGVDIDIFKGEFVAIMGPSGSGKSTTAIPKIAGLDKNYMYQTLLEYKTGKRVDTHMMQKHTKGFTDEELEQLSYYFSKVK